MGVLTLSDRNKINELIAIRSLKLINLRDAIVSDEHFNKLIEVENDDDFFEYFQSVVRDNGLAYTFNYNSDFVNFQSLLTHNLHSIEIDGFSKFKIFDLLVIEEIENIKKLRELRDFIFDDLEKQMFAIRY